MALEQQGGETNWTAIVIGILGAIGTLITGVLGAMGGFRKGRTEERKENAVIHKQEVATSVEEETARQELRQKAEAWAVKEARDISDELKKQLRAMVKSERECHLRLAMFVARDRESRRRIRELEKRLGIEREDDEPDAQDRWADSIMEAERTRLEKGGDE